MGASVAVLQFYLVGYARTWRASVLSSFVLPVLFVLGFGLGVGRLVDAGGSMGSVRYLDFIVPGMIASSALQIAFGESAWPIMSNFLWNKMYYAMVAAPLRTIDIVAGNLAFIVLRVASSTAIFLAVTMLFGSIHSLWSLAVVPVGALLGLGIGSLCMALAGRLESDSYFPLVQRFLIIPMTLFAGVFFPVSSLPVGARWLAYISPLWHAVEVCRDATFGVGAFWPIVGHLAYLALWGVVGVWLAWLSFRKRLIV